MQHLPIGQRVRINSLEFLFVHRLTGTVTGQPDATQPYYRVALDGRYGGGSIDARPAELVALPTEPAETASPPPFRLPRLPWVTARETLASQ